MHSVRPPRFVPALIPCLRAYDRNSFTADLLAGVTVGLVALPLALAFSIASGCPPQAGLYCAIIAGFICAALGGSRYQVSGPTGAFVIVISRIVEEHGLDGLFLCTAMSGIFLFILGVTGLGTVVKFIPRPVIVGFTNGIAVLIASTQIKDFLGLQLESVPGDFIGRMRAILTAAPTISWWAGALSTLSLIALLMLRRVIPRVPPTIIVLAVGTALVALFGVPIETVQSRFGEIPHGLPTLVIPQFRPDLVLHLISPAITVTMLGAIESLLSAVVADRMTNGKHDPNVELTAQGIANFLTPLAGGLPATGAIARTATNIRAGARTPVAGMIHALTLASILLFAAPLAGRIPLALLAAILIMVAYNMGEWHEIPRILRLGIADIAVWAITFLLTVFADLTVAVEAGLILAALLFIRRVTDGTTVTEITPDDIAAGKPHVLQNREIPPGVAIFRVHGPFLFGAADKLAPIWSRIESLPPVVILRLRNMTAIDATGLSAIEDLAELLHRTKRQMIICGLRDQPRQFLEEADIAERLSEKNICPHFEAALNRAREILGAEAVSVSSTRGDRPATTPLPH